jgi:hypothetical protein
MKKSLALLVIGVLAVAAAPASAKTTKGHLYHDGSIVRTVVNPAKLPHGGTDPLYVVTNGVSEQLAVAGIAPGTPGYRGGAWAVFRVTFQPSVTPYLLTSDEAVAAAEAAGDVALTRDTAADFRCPNQP